MYKVSVIVPVYNAERYIEDCVLSLFKQTLDSIEYIFVDDCSPDNSMNILERIMKKYPERANDTVILRHEKNTGQSGARKDGMALARGEYIIHCDADDWIDPDMYECMYNKAKEDNVEAVCCDIALEHQEFTKVLKINCDYEDHRLMYDCLAPISVEYFSLCNRLVSRKVYERQPIVPFEGVNMWDDVGLSIRIRYHVRNTSVINRAFYHYNRKNEISTTKRPLMDRIREQILCIQFIEDFFNEEQALNRYRLFVSYLKIHTIEEIFPYDADMWLETFKGVRHDLWKLRKMYRRSRLFKFYTLGYCGTIGKLIWKTFWKR